MVLTAYSALSPVTGLFCHRHLADTGVSGPLGLTSPSTKLDASVGASGPHGFAVRGRVIRLVTPPRPPHPAPNVRDDRDTPLMRGRDGVRFKSVSTGRRSEIFLREGLDRGINGMPVGQISPLLHLAPLMGR